MAKEKWDIKPVLSGVLHKKGLIFIIAGVMLLFILVVAIATPMMDRGIRLVSMEPSGEINIKTNLTFSFSADVIDQKEVGMTLNEELIKFSPKMPGRFRWISRRELRFLPEAPFHPSTSYTAQLKPVIVRLSEKFLAGNRKLKFATQRFKVNNVNISFNSPGEQQKGYLMQASLSFNYPIDPNELRKALELRFRHNKREIKYNLNTTEPNADLIITSEPIFSDEKDKTIELNIARGLRCVGSQLGLAESYTSDAILGAKRDLNIIEASSKTDDSKCWIAVRCSETAEAKTVANFIKLKPNVPFQIEVNGDYILIKSDKFKPGDSYNIRVIPGLSAVNGYPLKREFSYTVFFTDLEPSLKFNTPGRYLSSKGNLNLGLETVNVERINLEVSQIYANNIVSYLNSINYDDYVYSDYIDRLGRVAKSTVLNLNVSKNEMLTTPINLQEYLGEGFRGILQVVVYDDEERWRQDTKYVIVTDLGIVGKVGEDELTVWVNSLESLEPKVKTKVSLISKNNQTLATELTDSQGIARFKGIKKATAGFEPFIILAELDSDFAFVHFPSSQLSTTDFDVRGRRHLLDGYEAFVYLDRDIFRPGDQANIVALIRGANSVLPPDFPVKLEIRQPDGQIFKELKSNTRNTGACEFSLSLPDYAQTGKYQANLRVAEETVGSAKFSVEEFMPERIKVTTHLDKTTYSAGDAAQIKIEGINLFGPPAAGRRAELKLTLETAAFTAPGFDSYTFGDSGRTFNIKEEQLGEGKLDANGLMSFNYTFPTGMTPPAKLRAIFQGTVIEDGGRAVSSFKATDVHPYQRYIGVKPLSDYYCDLNQAYQLKYVVVNPEGKILEANNLEAEVYRITWNSIYRKNAQGRFEYVSEQERTRVQKRALNGGKGEQTFQFTPKDYGQYQIVIADSKSESRASVEFYACGWGYSPWMMDAPEKIQLESEKKIYKVGDQAEIQIKAPFAGKALITVEREKVYDVKIVDLKQNSGVVKIPVKEEYKPNVYVSVHLIRSIKSLEKRAPVRAFGVIPLMVDCRDHQMEVEMDVPKEVRPEREIEVTVKVNQGSAATSLTLAAVDEGICQLTDYQTPNPADFFYGKRGLNIKSYDLYGMILPEVENVKTRSTPGGDADMEGVRKQNLNPVAVRRVKPVSLWSGLINPDRNGVAKIKLHIPQFNGTLRLMAVAASNNNFGAVQKKVIVRDPIVMTPTFPRFIAGNDRFEVPVSVFNGTGKTGNFQVSLKAEGPVEIISDTRQSVSLKDQEEKPLVFEVNAKNKIGKVSFTVQVKGNGETCEIKEELPLRPSVPLTQELKTGSVTVKRPLQLTPDQEWIPGTATYQLTLAPFPTLKFAGSLQYLLGYPHGCLEQTTSKLFPLLYFDSLAQAAQSEVFKGGNANYYINQGIEKLESMQLRDGSFAYWPGGYYQNEWGSVYASHFLVEARKAGFAVSDRIYQRMLTNMDVVARANDKSNYRLQTRVYALYVLSLAGKPQLSTMAYIRSLAPDKLSDYSWAQLAAAYYYAGDRKTARELLPEAFAASVDKRETGGNFNSPVRSDAVILSVLADVHPTHKAVFKLVDRLSREAKPGYWGTTQENAFALMALGKLYQKKSEGSYQGEVLVNGKKLAAFDNQKPFELKDARLGQGQIEIRINGDGECYYFLKVSGIRDAAGVKEYNNGLMVTREYLDRQGNRVDPAQIKQGDLIISHLQITSQQERLNNLAVVDMLPAGLEIENPRLASSAKLAWLNNKSLTPDYLDVRDDRLIIFVSLENSGTHHFYYASRAVACGDFTLPSLKAECMYNPEISSYSGSGEIRIRR